MYRMWQGIQIEKKKIIEDYVKEYLQYYYALSKDVKRLHKWIVITTIIEATIYSTILLSTMAGNNLIYLSEKLNNGSIVTVSVGILAFVGIFYGLLMKENVGKKLKKVADKLAWYELKIMDDNNNKHLLKDLKIRSMTHIQSQLKLLQL